MLFATAAQPATISAPVLEFLIVITIWSLIWKGFAVWRAARLGQRNWFIAMLVLNTAGILEIIYLFIMTRNTPNGEDEDED